MKRFLIIFGLILLFMLQTGAVHAADDYGGLEAAAGDSMEGISVSDNLSLGEGIATLLNRVSEQFSSVVKGGIRSAVLLIVIALLCSLLNGISVGGFDAATLAGVAGILALSVTDINALMRVGQQTIDNMELFSKALLPTITAAAAAAGAPTGATMRQLATMFCSDLLLTLINRLLIPMTYAYIGASAGYAALGNDGLKRIASSIKWLISTILATALVLFVGYLGISGVISGTTDALTVKAAKLTMSSLVPVVGGIISDAAETVLAGAGMLRNSIGIFGTLAIIGFCLIPFLRLGVQYLAYKVAAALSSTVTENRLGALIDSLAGAFGLVLAMTGSCAFLLLFSIISALGVVLP